MGRKEAFISRLLQYCHSTPNLVVLVTPSGKIGYQLQRQFLRMRYLDGSFAGLIHGKLVLKSLYGFGAWIGAYMILANITITEE